MSQGLRISELAERSGVPVPTIKYYLREGLLPEGTRVSSRLTEYDERHVRQLGLLRILREVGDIPIEGLRRLVDAAAARGGTVHDLFAAAADALAPTPPPPGELRKQTRTIADRIIDDGGWTKVRPSSPDRENLAAALEVVARYGNRPYEQSEITPYIRIVDELARGEIASLDDARDRVGLLEEMVIGQVAFGQVLIILRRLAEEHYSQLRFGDDHRH